jgi:peptidyl-prolyl cis-trans isomerase D
VIQAYYDSHKADFRSPEYRNIVVLSLTPGDVAKPDEVSDADARSFYERNIGRFGTPERRQLEQIVFPNEEEARAALARLGNEFSFEALAKERGITEKDLDLGLMTKSDIFDKAVADAAFALQEGAISEPIKGAFGVTLVKVVKIEPDQSKKFEDVAAEIKQTVANDRARSEIAKRHDKIEDERGAGLRLAEIAPKIGLKASVFDAVDRNGRDPEGKSVSGWPAGINPISSAFTTDVGVDSEPLQVPGGGYVWVEVLGIKPARDRPLDEVRAEVEQRWRNEEISKRLQAKASEMVEKLKGGAPFADVAGAEGLTPQTTFGIKRGGNPGNNTISPRVIEAVFQAEKDAAGSAEGNGPAEWVVFRLTDITVPDFDAASSEAKRVAEAMRGQLREDLMAQYVQRLQTDLGVTINQDALRRVAGGEQ